MRRLAIIAALVELVVLGGLIVMSSGCGGAMRGAPRPVAPSEAPVLEDQAGDELIFPIAGAPGCSRGFAPAERHFALDVPAPAGTPVLASAPGVVLRASRHRDYGLLVVLRHRGFTYTLYAHLSRLAVEEGGRVDAGETVGEVGSTGNASGSHLHFEVLRAAAPLPLRADGPLGLPAEAYRIDPATALAAPLSCLSGMSLRSSPPPPWRRP